MPFGPSRYDPEIYLIENPIHRYNLTSRQNVMKLNPDGSLDIYLQDSSPGGVGVELASDSFR